MMSLIDELERHRARAGLAPLPDPSVIYDDPRVTATRPEGAPLPPPPPVPTPPPDLDVLPDPLEDMPWPEDAPEAPTPDELEQQSRPAEIAGAQAIVALLASKELVVHDSAAMYRQRAVTLNEGEKKQVVKVVLRAIRRSLDEQFAEVAGPKRVRRRAAAQSSASVSGAQAVQESGGAPAPSNKRRGRPPRQRLDGSEA